MRRAVSRFSTLIQRPDLKGGQQVLFNDLFMHLGSSTPWRQDDDALRGGHLLQYQKGMGTAQGATDYDLSLGKIRDTLHSDYPAFFERRPNFEIYDERVVFELGQPFHSAAALRGKRAYSRAVGALQRLACSTVQDGSVRCRICDGEAFGHALKVPWHLHGSLRALPFLDERCATVHIHAISLYSVAPQASESSESSPLLTHRIHRHCIEFVEIQPPSLRSILMSLWWRPQLQSALALKPAV
mmetsp:Transcript_100961/g.184165  ORF Transcript_100961/g.184165 Transcript_100961/m.184165 type:complete len:242 (-) Transcript_100961:59-784(-)